jgi:hypothetical protein
MIVLGAAGLTGRMLPGVVAGGLGAGIGVTA